MTLHKPSPDSRRDSGAMELQHNQLFSFPRKEQVERTKEKPATPLHSSVNDSILSATPMPSSNISATPSSTNDSTPSFRNFLDRRSSTSLSEHANEPPSMTRSMPADSAEESDEGYDEEQAACASPKAAPRPIRHHSEFSIHSSPGDRQRQINTAIASTTPETVSLRALPLFQLLQEKTTTIEMGIAGLLEWVEFWISRGTRVRVLSKEMEEVRNELQNRLRSGCISPLACVEQTSKLEAIFTAEEITSRVPPRTHQFPGLLDDGAMATMDEKMVADCLVATNDRLVRPQRKRGRDVKQFGKPLRDTAETPFRGGAKAEPGAKLHFPAFVPPPERQLRGPTSPKAKRLLGIHALATPSTTGSSTPVSAFTPIRSSPLSLASKFPSPNKTANFLDLSSPTSPMDAEAKLERRDQIYSAPVMGRSLHENKLGTTSFTAPRRAHYPVQREKSYRKPAPSLDVGSRAQVRSTGSVQGMKLPAIDTQSPFASPRQRTGCRVTNPVERSHRARGADDGQRKQPEETAVHAEQITEVLLEYVNRLVRRLVRGGKGEDDVDGLREVVKNLNHISFETRVRILNKSNAIHPMIASTLHKVRFSLGYIDARHLVQAVERIENDGSTGLQLGILRRPPSDAHLDLSTVVSAKKLIMAWLSANRANDYANRKHQLSKEMQLVVRQCFEEALLPTIPIPPIILDDSRRNDVALTANKRPNRSVSLSTPSFATSLKRSPETLLLSDMRYRNGSMPSLSMPIQSLRADTPGFETVDGLIHWIFSDPTTTNTQELLIEWISNERLRRIRTGQGWLIRLAPNSLSRPTFSHGSTAMSAVLAEVAKQCLFRKQAQLIRIVHEVQALFSIPVSSDKASKRTTISGKAHNISSNAKSAAASIGRNGVGAREEGNRISQQAPQKANDKPRHGQTTLIPSDRLSSKERNVSQISGHSHGDPYDDASVFATVNTFSHNSCYTTMSSVPATQRLAMFTFSEQSSYRTRSPIQDGVYKRPLPGASPTAAPVLLCKKSGDALAKSSDVDLVPYGPTVNLNASRDTTFETKHIQSSSLLDSPPILGPTGILGPNQAPRTFPSSVGEPTRFPPTRQSLHSSPSLPGSLSTTSGALLSALSFVLPMFNQDCSVRYSVTPGQLEINLLKMIEFERQKCISSGISWGEEQSASLSWMMENIRNLQQRARIRTLDAKFSDFFANVSTPPSLGGFTTDHTRYATGLVARLAISATRHSR
ncbi:hypothetical protein QFC21_002149 [Naganishia friedmannii]|uniref:Uncharacterized protein n=1 Tax=Naganishia friedmannii TaxID=89922 RepID=A0ACC2W1A5_9TREE|nr:hypothetical protein QFC21_002149 [Naganishia friedmannii]